MTYIKPNHPDPTVIPHQELQNKTLKFQERWFRDYPWLHYVPNADGVFCFYCMEAFKRQSSPLAKSMDEAFVSTGFKNWKKAIGKFQIHQQSQAHKVAMNTYTYQHRSVEAQLSTAKEQQQREARSCLLKIIKSVRYLARQGLALRGHESDEGNLVMLLQDKAEDDDVLKQWLSKPTDHYTSPEIQNEILNIMANTVLRTISSTLHALPKLQFSIIMDGVQDISGSEQESICLRYVDDDLLPHEDFIGVYEVSSTTGKDLARVATDVLLRLNLPLSSLRGQSYDGAANMAGGVKGVQAVLRESQPLALYVHCGPHCVNLVTQTACTSSAVVTDALDLVHKLGTLYHQSSKYKTIFKEIAHSEEGSFRTLKPLCPTRWLMRVAAIRAVIGQYEEVLQSLEEMAASGSSDTCRTARGLLERFQKGQVVLGLFLASQVLEHLECLNRSLQSKTATVTGMMAAVDCVRKTFQVKRSDETFHQIYTTVCAKICELDIEPVQMPHIRRPPQRYTGNAPAFRPTSTEEYFRIEFFKLLDAVDVQLAERFDQDSFHTLSKLERVLISGKVEDVSSYPELNHHSLEVQLAMFKLQYPCSTVTEVAETLRNMLPEVRALFTEVEVLVRLLLVVPCSSAEAERSFSALRRLKTWLRSSMKQRRLNNVAVCHIHQDKLDQLNVKEIGESFVSKSDKRRHIFGSFV